MIVILIHVWSFMSIIILLGNNMLIYRLLLNEWNSKYCYLLVQKLLMSQLTLILQYVIWLLINVWVRYCFHNFSLAVNLDPYVVLLSFLVNSLPNFSSLSVSIKPLKLWVFPGNCLFKPVYFILFFLASFFSVLTFFILSVYHGLSH